MELARWVDDLYERNDRAAHEIMRRIAELAIKQSEEAPDGESIQAEHVA